MAWLNADVKDGVHMNFSVECFPAVATSKGVKTEELYILFALCSERVK